jgi:putative flippase GtrA
MRRIGQEFIKFIVIGVINTFNYYMIYLFLHAVATFSYMSAHVIAFLFSFVLSFFLNSYFTFKVKPTLSKFLKFPLSQAFNFSVSSLFMYVFVEYFHINSTITPILAVLIAVPMTFTVTGKILKKESVSG